MMDFCCSNIQSSDMIRIFLEQVSRCFMRKFLSICLLVSVIPVLALSQKPTAHKTATRPAPLKWQPWSDEVFAQAQREHRFVLLDLEAIWCHWCHVMDETTY